MNRQVLILRTALTPIVWGTTYIVTTSWLPANHPVTAGMLRALPAGLILLLIVRALPRGIWWWRSFVLGALNIGIFFALLFTAAIQLPGGVAAILTATSPFFAMALSPALLGHSPTRHQLVGGLFALAGIAAITITPGAKLTFVGAAAGLGAAASMGLGIVLAKRWGQPNGASPLHTTAWQLTTGGLLLVPFALLEGPMPDLDWAGVAGFAYLCIFGALLAYPNMFAGLSRLDATTVLLLNALSPVTAILIDAATRSTPTPLQVTGIIIVLVALLFAQKPTTRRA